MFLTVEERNARSGVFYIEKIFSEIDGFRV